MRNRQDDLFPINPRVIFKFLPKSNKYILNLRFSILFFYSYLNILLLLLNSTTVYSDTIIIHVLFSSQSMMPGTRILQWLISSSGKKLSWVREAPF